MINYPAISVVIPTWNEANRLPSCLGSIHSQNYQGKLEVIVVDDNSTDTTVKIAKSFGAKVLTHSSHRAEIGKKIGFDASKANYFLFLDADINLIGPNWFTAMIEPLLHDQTLTASFCGYSSKPADTPLNKYITLDFLQRDPLFSYLTPSLSQVVVAVNSNWLTCKYIPQKMLPAGLCLFRTNILKPLIKSRLKFMELDNIALLVKNNHTLFAYVPTVSMHHPFISSLKILAFKRGRNLQEMYFDQPDPRVWTWINWKNPLDIFKVLMWITYANSIILPILVGLVKSIKHHTWVGLYEAPFVWLTTNLIIYHFLLRAVKNFNGKK